MRNGYFLFGHTMVVVIVIGMGYVYLRITRTSMVYCIDVGDRTSDLVDSDWRGVVSRITLWRSIFGGLFGYLLFCKMVYVSSL